MRFLVFNVTVVLALVYLFSDDVGERILETAKTNWQGNDAPATAIAEPSRAPSSDHVAAAPKQVAAFTEQAQPDPAPQPIQQRIVTEQPESASSSAPLAGSNMPPIAEAVDVPVVDAKAPSFDKLVEPAMDEAPVQYMSARERSNELSKLVDDMEIFAARIITR